MLKTINKTAWIFIIRFFQARCNPPGIKIYILAKRCVICQHESLDLAYHRGLDNKFTYTLNWTQILLILSNDKKVWATSG